jgi:hypothetical protein
MTGFAGAAGLGTTVSTVDNPSHLRTIDFEHKTRRDRKLFQVGQHL